MNFPPIDVSGDNILKLPVKNKQDDAKDLFLVPPPHGKCIHFQGPFEVDVKAGKCICKTCNEEVSAMFVLEQLMKQESRWMQTRAGYQDEMKRLAERSRCKCQHCGKMTRISR